MTKEDVVAKMQAGSAWVPGKRVRIDFGGEHGAIMLDGAAQKVSEEDGAADTTIRVRVENGRPTEADFTLPVPPR